MHRCFVSLIAIALLAVPAWAHFIWIIPGKPDAGKATARVQFTNELQPETPDLLAKIAKTEFFVRTATNKSETLKWPGDKPEFVIPGSDRGPTIIAGVCRYGVIQQANSDPFLLMYYAKTFLGVPPGAAPLFQKTCEQLPLEITPTKDAGTFLVSWHGKPLADAEIAIIPPDRKSAECKSDRQGHFTIEMGNKGLHGIRARYVEKRDGEHDGKKFTAVRHYSTLVFDSTPPGTRK